METIRSAAEHINYWVDYVEDTLHEKLRERIEVVEQDLVNAKKRCKEIPELLKCLEDEFSKVKSSVISTMSKESSEVLSTIRQSFTRFTRTRKEDVLNHLADPVRKITMEHHKILDRIHNMLPVVTRLGYKGFTKRDHLRLYTNLFDFYNTYNKLIYVEEHMLIPALAAVLEKKQEADQRMILQDE